MKIHDIAQGSDAWHQFRLEHNGASEAAAMLGLSTRMRRTELLHVKHTGNAREFSDWVQRNILDKGHEVERLARPNFEALLGEDLYPVTCSNGMESASCDGLTMDERRAWEHKLWNDELAASVAAGVVPDEHMPQCQQILMVTGAEEVIFGVSDGTPEKMVHTVVLPDAAWFERIRAGWAQFDKDLAAYVPVVYPDKPVGKAPKTLPALRIEITGAVTASNLAEFKETALAAIRGVNRELKTDTDFADAAESVKWFEDVESRLAAAKEHALSQTSTIDELFKAIDDISAEARAVRLELDKLVTRRKAEIKDGIVLKAADAYREHVAGLKTETEGIWLTLSAPDFAGAAKAKRTVATLQDAVDTCLATAKIEADASAKRIRDALACLKTESGEYAFLFADKAALVSKPIDDLKLAIKARIDAHKEAEEKKKLAAAPAPAPAAVPAPVAPVRTSFGGGRAAVADTRPPITTGQLCERLGFTVTAGFIESLGITPAPAPAKKTGTWWHMRDFTPICLALARHLDSLVAEAVAA